MHFRGRRTKKAAALIRDLKEYQMTYICNPMNLPYRYQFFKV